MTAKKKIDQKHNQYRYCVAYDIDKDKTKLDGHNVRWIYYLKVDLTKKDGVSKESKPFRCNIHGGIKTKAGGLLPIRNTFEQAYAKVKAMAEKLQRHEERKAAARRGFVKQNDSEMKLTVLCRHKGQDKYGYAPKKLDPEDAAARKENLAIGRIKGAIKTLDSFGISHPNLSAKLKLL